MKIFAGKGRLILIVAGLLAFGFFITNLISYFSAKQSLRNDIINTSLPLTRDNIYSEIQRDLMRPIFISSSMAGDTFLRDWAISGEKDHTAIKRYLSEIVNKNGLFTAFFVSENTGNYYYHGGILKQISKQDPHDVWYYDFVNQHVPYELDVDENQAAHNKMTIFINHSVYDFNHKLIGVTGVGLDLERISNLLSEYQVKYDREIYLVDTKGDVQVKSKYISLKERNIKKEQGLKIFADDLLAVSQVYKNFEYDSGRVHFLVTTRYIPELDWFLVVSQNQNRAIRDIWNNFIKNMIFDLAISMIIISVIAASVNYYQKQLEIVAATDHLTGTFNRREFSRIFEMAVEKYRRTASEFAIVLLDIDMLKDINDKFGYTIGDRVISRITEITSASLRKSDMQARWGGDEFIVIASGGLSSARQMSERVLSSVKSDAQLKSLAGGGEVTVSIGIAVYEPDDTEAEITARAEKALNLAKEKGRGSIGVF